MIGKLINYLKWRWSEEGRQTRLFEKESRRLLIKGERCCELKDRNGFDDCMTDRIKLHLRYPKAKQAVTLEQMGTRPGQYTPEEWLEAVTTPSYKRKHLSISRRRVSPDGQIIYLGERPDDEE